ncbi:MAG: toll/interleukin-1 receptor domain-containing protein [Bacteroidota bacterium]
MSFFPENYTHEVFLSHAIEDRAAIADELYAALKNAGIKLWYSGDALTSGEDLKREIEVAIDGSRFGVVVFSKGSIHRQWMITELNWLEKKEINNTIVVLPVLYDMTIAELAVIYPRYAARFCIHWHRGVEYTVAQILEHVKKHREIQKLIWRRFLFSLAAIVLSLIFAVSFITYFITHDRPTGEQIENVINERIQAVTNMVDNRYVEPVKREGVVVRQAKIDSTRLAYLETGTSHLRNEYEFNNGTSIIHARMHVEDAIGKDVVELAETPGYGMDSLDIYWSAPTVVDGFRHVSFSLVNKRPIQFSSKGRKNGTVYSVTVNYTNGIQFINVSLTIPPTPAGTKRHEMILAGLGPVETYYFEKGLDGEWYFKEVKQALP